MAFESEQQAAKRLLSGVEDGRVNTSELASLVDDADPALVYLIFTWLRERYRNDPAADGVIGRLVTLSNAYAAVPRKVKEGESDPIARWFEDTYSYRELGSDEFIALIVEKLES